MIFELLKDFANVLDVMPEGHPRRRILKLFDEAIRRDVHFIDRHPTTFFQCMWNTCWWYDCPEAAKHCEEPEGGWTTSPPWEWDGPKLSELLSGWRAAKKEAKIEFHWVRSLRPPSVHLGTGQRIVLHGHQDAVNCVCYSPDGNRLVSGGKDRTLRIWDAHTGKVERVVRFESQVHSVSFAPDGRRVAIALQTRKVYVCDIHRDAGLKTLFGPDGSVNSVAFSPDGAQVVSGGGFGRICMCNADMSGFPHQLCGHLETVSSITYSQDGRYIVTGSHDKTVRVWDAKAREQLHSIRTHQAAVVDAAISPDGNRIVSAGSLEKTFVSAARTGSVLYNLQGDGGSILSVAFSPDGRKIASGTLNGTVSVWNAHSGSEIRQMLGHRGYVTSVGFSPDGQRIVSGSTDGTVRVWDAIEGEDLRLLKGENPHAARMVREAVFTNTGRHVLTDAGSQFHVWDVDTGVHLYSHEGRAVVSSPDGQFVAAGDVAGGLVQIWDAETGAEIRQFHGHTSTVRCLSYSPDSNRLVTGGEDATIRIWDPRNGDELQKMVCHSPDVNCAVFSGDGQRVIAGFSDGTVGVWDALSGLRRVLLRMQPRPIRRVSVSPDGRHIASGSNQVTIHVSDNAPRVQPQSLLRRFLNKVGVHRGSPDTRSRVLNFPENMHYVKDLAFSADGRRVFVCAAASFDRNGMACTWDLDTGECINVIQGFIDVKAAASLGCRWQAVGGREETIINDFRNGETIAACSARSQHIASHPTDCMWACLEHNHLVVMVLEGCVAP